jgi:uncharacterized sulfatase
MPGINLLDRAATESRDQLFGEVFTRDIADLENPTASLKYRWTIKDPWKLILPNLTNVPKGQPELYNLLADEHEKNNLAKEHPEIVAQLTKSLDNEEPLTEKRQP